MSLDELINGFCASAANYMPFARQEVERILNGPEKSLSAKYPTRQRDYVSEIYLWEGIKESVKAQNRNHCKAIGIFKKLWKYYCGLQGLPEDSKKFPAVDLSNQYDTLIYMLQFLQDFTTTTPKTGKIDEILEDELWMSTTSVKKYLNMVKGDEDNPLKIMGCEVSVGLDDINRPKALDSSCHPVFLPLNLVQVAALLLALNNMEYAGYEGTVKEITNYIWCQLTPYARDRLEKVYEEKFPPEYFNNREIEAPDKKFVFQKEIEMFNNSPTQKIIVITKLNHGEPMSPPLKICYHNNSKDYIFDGITIVTMKGGNNYEFSGPNGSVTLDITKVTILPF